MEDDERVRSEYSLTEYKTNDKTLKEILESGEILVFQTDYHGKLYNGEYDRLAFTDKRIIFYRKKGFAFNGWRGTKIFFEEKGTFSKKGILKIDIGMSEPIKLEGDLSKIKSLHHQIYLITS